MDTLQNKVKDQWLKLQELQLKVDHHLGELHGKKRQENQSTTGSNQSAGS